MLVFLLKQLRIEKFNKNMTYEEKERLAMDLAKQYGVEVGETIIFVSSNSKNNKSNAMKILQVE